jgi:GxxExxY protein
MTSPSQSDLPHRELTERIIGAFYEVYRELGYGFLESVYESAISIVLADAGLIVQRQAPLRVHFRGIPVGLFRPDLLIEEAVVVELKAARGLEAAHQAQLLNCLKATQIEVGLLFNFGPKAQFKRMVFARDRKQIRVLPRSSAVSRSSVAAGHQP